MWDLPGSGLEPVSPALADGFLTTVPSGKSKTALILNYAGSKTFNTLFFFSNLYLFIYLAALGLRCCVQAFSSCNDRGLLFIAVLGLLIVVASLVVEHGL